MSETCYSLDLHSYIVFLTKVNPMHDKKMTCYIHVHVYVSVWNMAVCIASYIPD